jgi:branched-chain amino acid transport system ATP-binding protein
VSSAEATAPPSLTIANIQLQFGGVRALDDVSFSVEGGQVCALIGPNGAGKTSLFNVISGLYRPGSGSVRYRDVELLATRRDRLPGLGVSRTFQNVALFPELSVLDNVLIGAHHTAPRDGFLLSSLQLPSTRRRERAATDLAMSLLDELGIGHVAGHLAHGLDMGTLKRVELARALAAKPSLLMLDEPAAGLPHGEVDELVALLRAIRSRFDLTLLIVEHHMRLVMTLSDHVVALNFGKVLAEGPPQIVAANPLVIEAYLGASA